MNYVLFDNFKPACKFSDLSQDLSAYTGCLLISVACLGINNLMIFWSLRAEILGYQTSKVYKLIHMKGLIKKLSCEQ